MSIPWQAAPAPSETGDYSRAARLPRLPLEDALLSRTTSALLGGIAAGLRRSGSARRPPLLLGPPTPSRLREARPQAIPPAGRTEGAVGLRAAAGSGLAGAVSPACPGPGFVHKRGAGRAPADKCDLESWGRDRTLPKRRVLRGGAPRSRALQAVAEAVAGRRPHALGPAVRPGPSCPAAGPDRSRPHSAWEFHILGPFPGPTGDPTPTYNPLLCLSRFFWTCGVGGGVAV